jgi:2-oxoglutarate ferredoxin oxidoreductase subunit beta
MINNGLYATTGGQLAPTTPMDQHTTTSPQGRTPEDGFPVHTAELVAQMKGTAYSARCSLTNAANYNRTKKCIKAALQKQIDGVGFSFVEILSTCPTNWHLSPLDAVKHVDEVVTKEYPLGEFKNVDKLG